MSTITLYLDSMARNASIPGDLEESHKARRKGHRRRNEMPPQAVMQMGESIEEALSLVQQGVDSDRIMEVLPSHFLYEMKMPDPSTWMDNLLPGQAVDGETPEMGDEDGDEEGEEDDEDGDEDGDEDEELDGDEGCDEEEDNGLGQTGEDGSFISGTMPTLTMPSRNPGASRPRGTEHIMTHGAKGPAEIPMGS